MNLPKYIADLLLTNNCVIVPNFGGFITNTQPAVIDTARQKIFPPSKNLLFNINLTTNDGLLANYVSQQISKTYAVSLKDIENVSNDWKLRLQNGERIDIGEAGFLYQKDNQIQFEQHREFNLLLDAYGLSAVRFVPISEKVIEKEVVPISIDTATEITFTANQTITDVVITEKAEDTKVIPITKPKKKSYWKYAAVACILPALFYSYWIPMNTTFLETGNIQTSDFNPLNTQPEKSYSKRLNIVDHSINYKTEVSLKELTKDINVAYYNYQFDEELYIPVKLDKLTIANTETAKHATVTENVNTNLNVHLIAGCFSSEANAKLLITQLKEKGYTAKIIDQNNGLFRVSAQSFASKTEAKTIKSTLSANGIDTWVLVK